MRLGSEFRTSMPHTHTSLPLIVNVVPLVHAAESITARAPGSGRTTRGVAGVPLASTPKQPEYTPAANDTVPPPATGLAALNAEARSNGDASDDPSPPPTGDTNTTPTAARAPPTPTTPTKPTTKTTNPTSTLTRRCGRSCDLMTSDADRSARRWPNGWGRAVPPSAARGHGEEIGEWDR